MYRWQAESGSVAESGQMGEQGGCLSVCASGLKQPKLRDWRFRACAHADQHTRTRLIIEEWIPKRILLMLGSKRGRSTVLSRTETPSRKQAELERQNSDIWFGFA